MKEFPLSRDKYFSDIRAQVDPHLLNKFAPSEKIGCKFIFAKFLKSAYIKLILNYPNQVSAKSLEQK